MRKCMLLLFLVISIGIEIEIMELVSAMEINLNEIALKIMEKNGGTNAEERQLEKCRKVGAAIVWSFCWESELLKMENTANVLVVENKISEESNNLKQIEEKLLRLFFEIENVKNFANCQNMMNLFMDFINLSHNINIAHIFKLVGKLRDENGQLSKMDEFMKKFLAENNFELELANEFAEFNKILGKDLGKQREENLHFKVSEEMAKTISDAHQLIVELNAQNDIKKIGKIINILAEKEKIYKLNNEWIKFQESENFKEIGAKMHENDVKKLMQQNIGEMLKNVFTEFTILCTKIEQRERGTEESENDYEETIYKILLNMTYSINLARWSIIPWKAEFIMHTELQQLITKFAILRRFLLQNKFTQRNEKKMINEKQKNEYDERQNELKQKLEQQMKWILRRQQRLEDQIHKDQQRKHFQSKFKEILVKIQEEFKKSFSHWKDEPILLGLVERPLRQYYYGNDEKQMLKIRRHGRHVYITLGNEYEYDYVTTPFAPRRTIFKKWIDVDLDENDENKAQPIKGLRKFSVAEVDSLFFQMPSKGWIPKNYDPLEMRYCISYAYEFVFQLNKGIWPKKDEWPQPYQEVDHQGSKDTFVSVFSEKYEKNYHPKFNGEKREDNKKCVIIIKELEIRIRMVKNEKWHEIERHQRKNKEKEITGTNEQMLPLAIVDYDTGRFEHFRYTNINNKLNFPFAFKEPLYIQEHLVKEAETPEAILYSALLKVNVCNVNGVPRAFVNNLRLWNNFEMTKLAHAFGGLNLYEENGAGIHLLTFEYGELHEKKLDFLGEMCLYHHVDYAKK